MPASSESTGAAAQLLSRLQLESASLASNSRSLVVHELGSEAAVFLSDWFKHNGIAEHAAEPDRLNGVDQIFGGAELADAERRQPTLLGREIAAIVEPFVEKLRSEFRRWLVNRIDDPAARLSSARAGLQWLEQQFRTLGAELKQQRSATVERLLELRRSVTCVAGSTTASDPQRVSSYFHLRVDNLAVMAAEHAVQALVCDAKALADEITALGREIDQIAAAFSRVGEDAGGSNDDHRTSSDGRLSTALRLQLPNIAAAVDARLQAECIKSLGGLLNVVMQGGRPRAQLTAKLHELSRQVVHDTVVGISMLDFNLADNGPGATSELQSGLAAATPPVVAFGGQRRVLAVLPRDARDTFAPDALNDAVGVEVTTIAGPDSSFSLCVEAEGLSLPHIAAEFIQHRRDRIEFAGRVHSRNDISWTPLIEYGQAPAGESWGDEALIETESQQALCKTLVM
jgi:hypothetical protein